MLGAIKESTNGWWTFNCPLCDMDRHKQKGAVHFDYGYMKCWECGMGYFIDQYLREVEGMDYAESLKYRSTPITPTLPKKSDVQLPDEFRMIYESGSFQGRVLSYMNRRGFTEEFLASKAVGYCDTGRYFGYLVVPMINRGKLDYWVARDALNRAGPKYVNPKEVSKTMLYNEEALDIYETVYHTEGIFDSWVIGDNAIASLGWGITPEQLNKILNSNCKNYVVVPDPGYEDKAYATAAKIAPYKQVYVKGTGQGDVNDIGREEFIKLPTTKFSYKEWIRRF